MKASQSISLDEPYVLAVGDSHSKFWSGYNTRGAVTRTRLPNVRILHLGPVTAHNINEEGASAGGKPRLRAKLAAMPTLPAAFIVNMGEIDCRTHIVKAAVLGKTDIRSAVELTVSRYMIFLDWLTTHYDRPAVVWGPSPTSPHARIKFNPKFPVVGSASERNYATFLFNDLLKQSIKDRPKLGFGSQYESLIDVGGQTLKTALFDGVHVDANHFQDAACRARKAFSDIGRPDLANLLMPWRIANTQQIVDVSQAASYTLLDATTAEHTPHTAANFFPCKRVSGEIRVDLMAGYSIKLVEMPAEDANNWTVQGAEDPTAFHDSRLDFHHDPDRSAHRKATVYSPESDRRFIRFLWLSPKHLKSLNTVRIMVRSFDPGLSSLSAAAVTSQASAGLRT